MPSRRDRPEPAGRRQRDAGRLVAAAFNDAARRIEETQKEKWPLYPPECSCRLALRCRSDETSPLLTQLMEALRCLPGVGRSRRSVWRSRCFSAIVAAGWSGAGAHPGDVGNRPLRRLSPFTEQEVCNICSNPRRQENGKSAWWRVRRTFTPSSRRGSFRSLFCVDGTPVTAGRHRSGYIGLDRLEQRLAEEKITEVISPPTPRLKVKLPLTTLPSFVAI